MADTNTNQKCMQMVYNRFDAFTAKNAELCCGIWTEEKSSIFWPSILTV